MKKPKIGKLKPVSNPHLRKAANKGRDYLPSAAVPKQTVTVKTPKFVLARGV